MNANLPLTTASPVISKWVEKRLIIQTKQSGCSGWAKALLVLFLLLFSPERRWLYRLGHVAVAVVAFAVVLAPWTIRNTRLQKTFITVDVMGGRNFMMGNYEFTPLNRPWAAIEIDGERSWHHVLRAKYAEEAKGLTQGQLDKLAMRYALERVQFGQPIFAFPRVARKIGRMIARTQAARQLAFHAARRKDSGDRCDLEAGMAKLLATRAAWEAADANVQIHGGNGYATEYVASRLLVDARVLSIFEGANEIQAHVVARRLLEDER